jgi:hypothetical protein
MVRNRRAVYGALAGLALVLAVYTLSRDDRAAAVSLSLPGLRTPATATADAQLPRIGLDRLQKPHGGVEVGKRDIFDFGPAPPTPPPPPPPPTPVPTAVAEVDASPTPPQLPPMSVKYIGSLADNRRGLKVAVLLNDRKEVLTGGVGEIVGNRFRIVSIGLESVDVQDVGSNRVQRIPLKGN